MFPAKCIDPEWGAEWEGPMFGVHVANAGVSGGKISVGDRLFVQKVLPGDGPWAKYSKYLPVLLLVFVLLHVGIFWFSMQLVNMGCLLYTSPSPRDRTRSRMPSSA
eukprot:TRINITY_DN17671_c0_g1_i1.p3 TRINITY_DN17671_c0_g1~~TRINITY_DN17671_c0_g1_i1.p3  ORF type:complete len:106 (-),score=31.04 TRINITY_DN17671_c0_g1_i1:35-352(-)